MFVIVGVIGYLGINNNLISWKEEASNFFKYKGPYDKGLNNSKRIFGLDFLNYGVKNTN